MDLRRKLELFKPHVMTISRHDDEDSTVRKTILQKMKDFIDEEIKEIEARVKKRTEAHLSDKKPVDRGTMQSTVELGQVEQPAEEAQQ